MDLISRLRLRQHHPRRRAVAVAGRGVGRRGRLEAGGVRHRRGFRRLLRMNGPSEGVGAADLAVAGPVAAAVAERVVAEPAVVGGGGGRRRGGVISGLLVALEVLFWTVKRPMKLDSLRECEGLHQLACSPELTLYC